MTKTKSQFIAVWFVALWALSIPIIALSLVMGW